jgi:hypothetical protein
LCAPHGKTPVLRVKLTREHLSMSSGITLDGLLFLQMREHAYTSETVVGFLWVLRMIRGKVLVIWDAATIHKCQLIKDFLVPKAICGMQRQARDVQSTPACVPIRPI